MKAALSRYFKHPENMLLGFVGRAVDQKFKLLADKYDGKSVLEHLLKIDGINIAILATGLPKYESFVGNIAVTRFSGSLTYEGILELPRRDNYCPIIAFDGEKAQQISLGSDVFLMPSLFEPCGITQMESMYNATPPLVRWTGGLVDTVKAHSLGDGTGFGFDCATCEEVLRNLVSSVRESQSMFRDNHEQYIELQRRAFRKRFLWSATAKQYIDKLYLS